MEESSAVSKELVSMVCDDKEIQEASKPEPFDWHTEMNKRARHNVPGIPG